EKWMTIKQVLIPIDRKVDEFQKLFLSNPISGPASAFKFSLEADMGKERIPTSESRKMMGADVADADGITGKGIKVAVLDTGTNVLGVQGPYLGGRSSVEGMPIQADENGHGSHVQTTVSGRPFQSIHGLLKGVAVDADVAAFKVLGYGVGAGTNISVLRGMMDAFEWRADIISMSLGSPYTEELPEELPECRAIKMLTEQGIICVVANGNDGPEPSTVGVPANSPEALSVGAVDINGNLASFSARGATAQGLIKPDCCAPGVNILSTSAGLIATMQFMDGPPLLAAISGTSMSTPHVSGIVALALQYARMKG
ncbi:MAG: S8 family serine peptidase, partial [Desulfobacterales bacterium]|nr:S8 family serine peptidase [Desulfobacterales bacterium]